MKLLPEYYILKHIEERYHYKASEILHLAKQGKIWIAYYIDGCDSIIEKGGKPEKEYYCDHFENYRGLVYLTKNTASQLLKTGSVEISYFVYPQDISYSFKFREKFKIEIKDLCISKVEVSRKIDSSLDQEKIRKANLNDLALIIFEKYYKNFYFKEGYYPQYTTVWNEIKKNKIKYDLVIDITDDSIFWRNYDENRKTVKRETFKNWMTDFQELLKPYNFSKEASLVIQ